MIWKNVVRTTASRRRFVATTLVYGLSLSVRFTSATGEEVEIPAKSLQRSRPMVWISSFPTKPPPPLRRLGCERHSPHRASHRLALGTAACRAGMS